MTATTTTATAAAIAAAARAARSAATEADKVRRDTQAAIEARRDLHRAIVWAAFQAQFLVDAQAALENKFGVDAGTLSETGAKFKARGDGEYALDLLSYEKLSSASAQLALSGPLTDLFVDDVTVTVRATWYSPESCWTTLQLDVPRYERRGMFRRPVKVGSTRHEIADLAQLGAALEDPTIAA